MPDRESQEEAFRMVENDVRAGLGPVGFEQDDSGGAEADDDGDRTPFRWGPPYTRLQSDPDGPEQYAVIPWKYAVRHVGTLDPEIEDAGLFHGMFPTGRQVTIHGVTFVDRSGDEPRFYRYVDWADALTQLGCTVSQRVVLDESAYVDGLRQVNEQRES